MNGTIQPFDLIVFGHLCYDELSSHGKCSSRLGGATYAASAAVRLGLKVGIVAGLIGGADATSSYIHQLQERGIDTSGVEIAEGRSIVYQISEADELVDQVTSRWGASNELLVFPTDIPESYKNAKCVLIYPVQLVAAEGTAKQLKDSGCVIALDLQHDIQHLEDAASLIQLSNFIFTNKGALAEVTGEATLAEGVKKIRNYTEGHIIVKMGAAGSRIYVYQQDGDDVQIDIPAYQGVPFLTVGAGDAYDAAFIAAYIGNSSLDRCGQNAALVATSVIESSSFDPSEAINFKTNDSLRQAISLPPERANDIILYIAGHFHSAPLKKQVERLAQAFERLGCRTFVPHRDVGIVGQGVNANQAFTADVAGIQSASAIISVLDGAYRGGTYFELGIAHQKNIPAFVLCTDETLGISNMVKRSAIAIERDEHSLVAAFLRHFGIGR